MKKKVYRIYSLNCPITNEVRYVGVTTKSLRRRLTKHIYEGKKQTGTHKINWIKSLLKENLQPTINLIELCNESDWADKEKYWISQYDNLTNMHEGGLHFENTSRDNTHIMRKVYQYDFEGNFINEYESLTDAAKIVGVSVSSLQRVTAGGRGSSAGFQWRLEKHDSIEPYSHEGYSEIICYKMIPQKLCEFKSMKEAAQELGIGYNSLISALNDNRPCKGYFFERKVKI